MKINVDTLISATCPVCHYTLAANFFDGGNQPLATLGWPGSSEEAQSMPLNRLDYAQCPRCTHVWNLSFNYEAIPYSKSPNRMFNKGMIWQGHLVDTKNILLSRLPENPLVIDIGCGEGHFVRGLAEDLRGLGRFIGFDPNTTAESGVGVEFYPSYFNPLSDIAKFSPDLLIMRHVLEHLLDPASFVDQLAWGAAQIDKPVRLFAEMPCIDKAISSRRLVDFFYEHPSQFTTQSFITLMRQGGEILEFNHGYDGEVIYALIDLKVPKLYRQVAQDSNEFYKQSFESKHQIHSQLREIFIAGKKVAIWGGTGKAAAFIHFFELNSKDFPLVVDSDLDKVGTFVSKMGQQIKYRDELKKEKVDVLIIPPQWRAKDILAEMHREEIEIDLVLIEHDGRLINFLDGNHPYI